MRRNIGHRAPRSVRWTLPPSVRVHNLIAALVRSARRSLCVRLGWSVAVAAEAWAQGVARRPRRS
jgi:hypothetical protein